jgi:RNA exonuclease 4
MPDRESVSSNWKILQKRLQAERPAKQDTIDSKLAGQKRKRAPIVKVTSKSRVTGPNSEAVKPRVHHVKRRKTAMGGYLSTNNNSSSSTTASNLIRDHDLSAGDLVAAYGITRNPSSISSRTSLPHRDASSSADSINAGLHLTHKVGKYIALDCEMVGVGAAPDYSDSLLARVSVVNFHGEQLYDSYVQPPPGIVVGDYRTQWSGIKPEHLREGVARPFAEVQREISSLLDGRVLVGHAVRNDLAVLMLSHPKRDVRDTARHAAFRVASKGKAPALRNLAKEELGWTIQTGEHSSLEDARATMMLFRKEKKAFEEENRRKFGQVRAGGKGKMAQRNAREETPASTVDGEEDEEEGDDDAGDEEDRRFVEEALTGEESDYGLAKAKAAPSNGKKRKKKKRTKRKQ